MPISLNVSISSYLCKINVVSIMLVCAVIGRELLVSGLREWMATRGARATVKVSFIGKLKTALQMISMALLLSSYETVSDTFPLLSVLPPLNTPFTLPIAFPLPTIFQTALILFYVSSWLSITSAIQYLKAAWPVLVNPTAAAI
jgi:CDP-diacylglycerol---glycerol-3-phosphate 3-phosphatidyltransferase